MLESWKKIAIRAAGFGAGFALLAALIIWTFAWWSARPVKPKPWNTSAITASFEGLDMEGDKNTLVFVYTLQNNTDFDYRISDENEIHLAATLKKSKSLSFDTSRFLKTDYPLYIPAKQRVRFMLHVNYPYEIKEDMSAPDDVRHDWETTVCQYVDKEFSNLEGFALLDDKSRYQVNIPNGWTARGKESLRVKSSADSN
jgi:hypothetical protein